jgi:hypothetical protein
MFGRPKPVVFDPYRRQRSRPLVPRWLLLLLVGALIGAGGVLYVQARHLPPRLSAEEASALTQSLESVRAERDRLQGELGETAKKLAAALAEKAHLSEELVVSRATADRLRGEVEAVVAALPPDPRGGPIEVRAARFEAQGADLAYDVVLSRERAGAKPFAGIMHVVLTGDGRRGGEVNVPLPPVEISVGSFQSVRGRASLPEGFKPRLATVNVLDAPDGKLYGKRVLNVR